MCHKTVLQFIPDTADRDKVVDAVMRFSPSLSLLKEDLFWDDSISHMETKEFREKMLPGLTKELMNYVQEELLTENMARSLVIQAHKRLFNPDCGGSVNIAGQNKKRKVRSSCNHEVHTIYN